MVDCHSAFDEKIDVGRMRVCASERLAWWGLLLPVSGDLADERGG